MPKFDPWKKRKGDPPDGSTRPGEAEGTPVPCSPEEGRGKGGEVPSDPNAQGPRPPIPLKPQGPPDLIPQPHGGAIYTSGVPGNRGGGRPKGVIREMCADLFVTGLPNLGRMAEGKPAQIQTGENEKGEPLFETVIPTDNDARGAMNVLGKYAGLQQIDLTGLTLLPDAELWKIATSGQPEGGPPGTGPSPVAEAKIPE